MKFTFIFILLFFNLKFLIAQENHFDHSLFDELLKEYVDDNGLVSYKGFLNDKKFDEYLTSIQNANTEGMSKSELLAFYINAYNALVIKNVIDHWPVESIMNVNGFFDKIKFNIAGSYKTLNEIEHQYVLTIEPVLSHFGLVCAAVSCPKLISAAYNGVDIFNQLEKNAIDFINNKSKNKLDRKTKTIYLSQIFNWYKKDFTEKYGSLLNTVKQFINPDDKDFLNENDVEIKFIPYNWKLNSQQQ